MNFKSEFFKKNRQRLFEKMDDDSVMVLLSNDQYAKNGDQKYPFRQQSDLYYFTGITQEETVLLLYKNNQGLAKEILFILEPNWKLETWEGKKLSKQDAVNISSVEEVVWNSNLETILDTIVGNKTTFYLLAKDAFSQVSDLNVKHLRFEQTIKKAYPNNTIISPRGIITELRLIKSREEIEMMQSAVNVTNQAFERVLEITKPGVIEYEIEAEISYIFRKNGTNGHAYDPIIASGINACSLHYVKNNSVLKDGDMLLMDFGADSNYYAADLSRTIPVNGQFTERQKELYSLVLDIQKKSIELFVPGNTIDLVNKKTNEWMKDSLSSIGLLKNKEDFSKYYPHGTSHFLGIDVHDVGQKDTVFKEGMVLTCEPGLYIQEESMGIRIENDIIVGGEPVDLMKDTVREIVEVENQMC